MEIHTQRIEEYILQRESEEDSGVNQLKRLGFTRYEAWSLQFLQQIYSQLIDIEERLLEGA